MKISKTIYCVGLLLLGSLTLSLTSCDNRDCSTPQEKKTEEKKTEEKKTEEKKIPEKKEEPKIVITTEGKLTTYPASLIPKDGAITLAAEVKSIGAGVFKDAASITSISAPNATEVEANAFEGCAALTKVEIPSVATIGEGAFKNCAKLELVSMTGAKAAPTVAANAFEGTPETKKLVVAEDQTKSAWVFDLYKTHKFATVNDKVPLDLSNPPHYESPTYPGEDATKASDAFKVFDNEILKLADQSKLQKHTVIPTFIKKIGRAGLKDLTTVKKLTAKGIESLSSSALRDASKLIDIEMPNLKTIMSYGLATFGYELKVLNKIYSVESIGENAFEGIENLQFIYLPNVKKIEKNAFSRSGGLSKEGSMVYFGATPPKITGGLGLKVHTLVIPKGSKAKYDAWEHKDEFTRILELGDPGTEKFEEYLYWTPTEEELK